jgi:hypothetical protein
MAYYFVFKRLIGAIPRVNHLLEAFHFSDFASCVALFSGANFGFGGF